MRPLHLPAAILLMAIALPAIPGICFSPRRETPVEPPVAQAPTLTSSPTHPPRIGWNCCEDQTTRRCVEPTAVTTRVDDGTEATSMVVRCEPGQVAAHCQWIQDRLACVTGLEENSP